MEFYKEDNDEDDKDLSDANVDEYTEEQIKLKSFLLQGLNLERLNF